VIAGRHSAKYRGGDLDLRAESIGLGHPQAACAKLDHAAKAIRLGCAEGFRTAMRRRIPSTKYKLIIIVSPVSSDGPGCHKDIAIG
jgi:hypothetical protein